MEEKKTPAWRRWLKRVAWGLLGLIVLLALFHRPIIFHTARYFVAKLAHEQNLDVQYDLGGTIFSSLSISNLHAKPIGPGPVERADIGLVNVRYSLAGLIRHGLVDLLDEVDLRDVNVILRPSPTPSKKEEKKSGGTSIPPLMPKRLNIVNVNFTSRAPEGDLEVVDFDFQLDPEKPGALRLKKLNVPGMRRWDDISGQATYKDRNLILTDVSAGPEIQLQRLGLDGSKLEQNELAVALEGTLLGSVTSLNARVTHLDKAKHMNVRAHVTDLNFDELWRYLNLHQDLHGSVSKLDLTFDGAPDHPVDWNGKIEAALQGVLYGEQPIGDVSSTVDLSGGQAHVLLTDQVNAQSKVTMQAEAALPEKMDGFAKTDATGEIHVAATDLAPLLKAQGIEAQGDVVLDMPFQWKKRRLTADLTLNSERLAMNDIEATKTTLSLHLEKTVEENMKSPLEKLATQLSATIENARFKNYQASAVKVALVNQGRDITVKELSLNRGANWLKLQGHAIAPEDLKSWQNAPLQVMVDLDARELQDFMAQGSATAVKGAVQIKGQASTEKGNYSGEFHIAAHDLESNEVKLSSVDGDLKIADGGVQITKLLAKVDERNQLSISGKAGLAAPFSYNLALNAALTDLSAFQPLLKKGNNAPTLGGSLSLDWSGNGEVQTNQHSGKATLNLINGRYGDQKDLQVGLATDYTPEKVNVGGLRVAAAQGEATLAAHWEKNRLQIQNIALTLQKTPVLAGNVDVPLVASKFKDMAQLIPQDQPITVTLQSRELDLKNLFQQLGQKPALTGKAQVNVDVKGALRDLTARVSVHGTQLQSMSAANLAPADVALDLDLQNGRLKMNGRVKQPLVQGMVLAGDVPLDLTQIKDPARLIPEDRPLSFSFNSGQVDLKKLFQELGQKQPAMSGLAEVNITAGGPLKTVVGNVALRGTRLQATAAANAAPADVALDLDIRQGHLKIAGSVKQPLLQGVELSGDVPLDLAQIKNPERLVPDDQPLKFVLKTGELDLEKILRAAGQKQPPVSGLAQVTLTADGNLKNLVADLAVRASKLRAASARNFAPADLALGINLKDNHLKVDGTLRQPLIQPLAVRGDMPVNVAAVMKSKTLDPQTPLNFEVSLPKSSLAFVPSLVPAIRFIKGTAAIDVKVRGNLTAPEFAGAVESDMDNLRFTDPGLPPLNNAVLRVNFTKNQVTLSRFTSGSAGGTLGASGLIKFEKITEPVFDLKVVSDKALVKQDDNITARVSCDLKVVGPLNAATLSGSVFVTKSHFFKDIDILPIGLPGRPAPQPPSQPSVVSFPNPPLRDWKFDVAIKTSDPFLIQGNLADGKATSDLHLGGTGLKPWLEGSARITHLTTSLPFSQLEINSGIIYFTQDAPFVPKLNIRGTSTIRDYNVTVTIYGTASAPQAVFSSEPPLPQSDVVALIATGTTTKELASDPNALAGRAAFLVLQKYYRKWFKKKDEPSRPDDSFLAHAQFDVGAVDPKTGKQSLAARVPLSEHFALSGGLDVGGDFRGQVKYLMRFR